METDTQKERLEALGIDASTVVEHGERLRASLEDRNSLPTDFPKRLDLLVEELRALRNDIQDALDISPEV